MSANENTEQVLLSDDAMLALGILQQPFDSNFEDFSYYIDDELQQVLDNLLVTLDDPTTLPVIVGQAGSGKTALLSLLIKQTQDSVQYFLVDGNENFSAFNVFSGMLEAFQEPAPDDFQICLDRLVVRLRSLEEQSLRAVILLDDADQVPTTELYQLISAMIYMQNGTMLDSFRIALTADSGFESDGIKIIPAGSNFKLQPLTTPRFNRDSNKQYIEHRLYQAGYLEPQPLDRKQLEKIHNLAQGIPGAINEQAAAILNKFLADPLGNSHYTEEKSWIHNNYFIGACALALVVIAGWLFLPPGSSKTSDDQVIITNEPMPDYSKVNGPPRLVLLSEIDSPDLASNEPKTLNLLGDSPEPPSTIKAKIVSQKKQESAPPKLNMPEPGPKVTKIKIVEKLETTKVAAKTKKISTKPKPQAIKKQIPKAETKVAQKAPEKSERKQNTPKETIRADSSDSGLFSLQSANWVLMQNPERFTVQMIASSSREEVERFLSITELPGPNSIFSFNRANETWYALVHGLFADVDDAKTAIKSLPKRVRANHPWIRQIKRIHDSLRESNQPGLS